MVGGEEPERGGGRGGGGWWAVLSPITPPPVIRVSIVGVDGFGKAEERRGRDRRNDIKTV